MRSMTGFGRGTGNDGKLAVTIEMRAVNQRFLELNIRMPHAYLALEDQLRSGIKGVLKRGKVDVFVTVQDWHRQRRISRSTMLPWVPLKRPLKGLRAAFLMAVPSF